MRKRYIFASALAFFFMFGSAYPTSGYPHSGEDKNCRGKRIDSGVNKPLAGQPINCPSGFSRIGPDRVRNSYCISTNEEAAANFFDAKDICRAKDTDGEGFARMCTHDEWYTACKEGADRGQAALTNMTDDFEWVSDFSGFMEAVVLGNGSCSTVIGSGGNLSNIITNLNLFRCCSR